VAFPKRLDIYEEADNFDWSLAKLAEKAGLAISTVTRICNLDTKYPRANTVFQLAKAVGFKITYTKKIRLKLRA
jgi:transcriptional regulator with XRE-family HTH domain